MYLCTQSCMFIFQQSPSSIPQPFPPAPRIQILHKTGLTCTQLKQRPAQPQLLPASHRVAPLLDLHHLLMKLKWSLKRKKGKRMKGKMPTAEGEGHPGKLRYK